jgi:hypothetical protein
MGEFNDEPEQTTRLDGNVAAGLLSELFCCEPSGAVIICAGCGASGPIGSLLAYGLEMGAILRCPICDTAVLRVGATGVMRWVDLRGAISMRFAVSG